MPIYCGEIPESQRAAHVAKLFGARFIFIESFAFDTASSLSPDYDGGLWTFNGLCNGGFYMAPSQPSQFKVECANGFDGVLSADAFGITCCLYAYSFLSFSPDEAFGTSCAEHFHKLRAYALDHPESVNMTESGSALGTIVIWSLFEVQQLLGHADPRMSMRYAHLSMKAMQEASNAASLSVA